MEIGSCNYCTAAIAGSVRHTPPANIVIFNPRLCVRLSSECALIRDRALGCDVYI